MIKAKQKEPSDSIFTLDDLIQESIEMNNFLKQKISSTSPNYQSLTNFFSQKIKLHNSFKKKLLGKKYLPRKCNYIFYNLFRPIELIFLT